MRQKPKKVTKKVKVSVNLKIILFIIRIGVEVVETKHFLGHILRSLGLPLFKLYYDVNR